MNIVRKLKIGKILNHDLISILKEEIKKSLIRFNIGIEVFYVTSDGDWCFESSVIDNRLWLINGDFYKEISPFNISLETIKEIMMIIHNVIIQEIIISNFNNLYVKKHYQEYLAKTF